LGEGERNTGFLGTSTRELNNGESDMMRTNRAVWAMAAAITLGMGLATTATAGALPRLKPADSRVEAFGVDAYEVVFEEGEPAVVALRGDGDTHLDLIVYDEDGIRIAADRDGGAISTAHWTPRWTGKFIIKIINRGPVYNHYRLGTN
jgi:hypothetical protein